MDSANLAMGAPKFKRKQPTNKRSTQYQCGGPASTRPARWPMIAPNQSLRWALTRRPWHAESVGPSSYSLIRCLVELFGLCCVFFCFSAVCACAHSESNENFFASMRPSPKTKKKREQEEQMSDVGTETPGKAARRAFNGHVRQARHFERWSVIFLAAIFFFCPCCIIFSVFCAFS